MQRQKRGEPGSISDRVLEKIVHNDELADQLNLQNEAAERLRERRHQAGALSLETTELQPILSREGHVIDLDIRRPNRASLLIEDLMVAANQVTALLLEEKREKRPQYSASRQRSRTVGSNRHLGEHTWRQSPFGAECEEPGRFLEAATPGQPGSLPRSFPLHRKAARARGVRVEIAGGRITGALWFSGATLFTLDRSEPPVSRSANTTSFEGSTGRQRYVVYDPGT